jgi:hypothetical protein
MKEMSKTDRNKLARLNCDIDDAIKRRTKWLDSKMSEYSDIQVGDTIYNIQTKELLGIVTKLYRYQTNQNVIYDTTLSICYEFRRYDDIIDNTSRQPYVIVGKKEQLW